MSRKEQFIEPKTTKKTRRRSRRQRIARQRECLARFDVQNRPALLAARRARTAARRRKAAK